MRGLMMERNESKDVRGKNHETNKNGTSKKIALDTFIRWICM